MTEVTKASFGATPDGRLVDVWTLRAGGYAAQVLTYGGILRSLTVPAPAAAGTSSWAVRPWRTMRSRTSTWGPWWAGWPTASAGPPLS